MADNDQPPGDADQRRYRVHLCFGPNCTERGSRALWPVLTEAVREQGLADSVEVLATTCRNRCDYGPSMNVYPGPVFYNELDREAIVTIVRDHLVRGAVVECCRFRPKQEFGRAGGRRKPDW